MSSIHLQTDASDVSDVGVGSTLNQMSKLPTNPSNIGYQQSLPGIKILLCKFPFPYLQLYPEETIPGRLSNSRLSYMCKHYHNEKPWLTSTFILWTDASDVGVGSTLNQMSKLPTNPSNIGYQQSLPGIKILLCKFPFPYLQLYPEETIPGRLSNSRLSYMCKHYHNEKPWLTSTFILWTDASDVGVGAVLSRWVNYEPIQPTSTVKPAISTWYQDPSLQIPLSLQLYPEETIPYISRLSNSCLSYMCKLRLTTSVVSHSISWCHQGMCSNLVVPISVKCFDLKIDILVLRATEIYYYDSVCPLCVRDTKWTPFCDHTSLLEATYLPLVMGTTPLNSSLT